MSTVHARWVLVLDGAPGADTSTVAALLAIATGAAHLSAYSPTSDFKEAVQVDKEAVSRLATDVAHHLDSTGRVIVEIPLQSGVPPGNDWRASVAALAGPRDVQLLTVQLTGSDEHAERSITAQAAMAPDERGHPTASVAVDGLHLRGVGDTGPVVSIATDGLMAEQVVAVLNPVLSGPRQPDELDEHVARRLSILSLMGLPVAGRSITELITRHLERDSADAGLLARWWRSTVIDENTAQPVLDPETFLWIDQFSGPSTRPGWPVSHAGLLHTYGYTLSTAWTRYGWKSDRYIDGTLATLLGIDVDDLTPWAAAGTVLSNLTEALDALIASDQPRHLIEESGRLVDIGGGSADGTLRTRIYEPSAPDAQLLVYTVEFAGTGVERYLTSFPMGGIAVETLLADTEARSRFNVAATLNAGSRTVRTR